jgi:hypothetical protein
MIRDEIKALKSLSNAIEKNRKRAAAESQKFVQMEQAAFDKKLIADMKKDLLAKAKWEEK